MESIYSFSEETAGIMWMHDCQLVSVSAKEKKKWTLAQLESGSSSANQQPLSVTG